MLERLERRAEAPVALGTAATPPRASSSRPPRPPLSAASVGSEPRSGATPPGSAASAAHPQPRETALRPSAAELWAKESGLDLSAQRADGPRTPVRAAPSSAHRSPLEAAREAAVAWTSLSAADGSRRTPETARSDASSAPREGPFRAGGRQRSGGSASSSPADSSTHASPALGRRFGAGSSEVHRALFRAAKRGDVAHVAALLASAHERALAGSGSTPPREAVRALLDAPWDGPGSSQGWSLLHVACEQGHAQLAALLLERGACARAAHGRTGLASIHFAAREGKAELAALLLEAGADGAAAEAHGWTALHLAAQAGDEAMASLLLAHAPHALHSRTAKRRESALHVAARYGRLRCALLLLQADADPAALDSADRTPLELALVHGQAPLVQLLKQWPPNGRQRAGLGSPAAAAAAAARAREKGGNGSQAGSPAPPASCDGQGSSDAPSQATGARRQATGALVEPRSPLLGLLVRALVGALGCACTLALSVCLLALVSADIVCDGSSNVCAPT